MKDKKAGLRWFGLTGGIASGKSEVAALLRKLNYKVADADQLAREVVSPGTSGLRSVEQAFGPGVLTANHELDRARLAQIVFENKQALNTLEGILHPLIQAKVLELKKEWQGQGLQIAFYDVPLLFEKNMQKQFDAVVLVFCSEQTQKLRLKMRNNFSDQEIENRLKNQIPLLEKKSKADYVVFNEGDRQELEDNVKNLLIKIQTDLKNKS